MRWRALAMAISLGAATTVSAETFLLVSASQDAKVNRFAIDEDTGRLTPARTYETGDGPGPIAVSPDGRTLYLSLRGENRAASYRIAPQTGDLAPLNDIDVGGSATFITTDRTGRYLLAAYYALGKVNVHAIESDGSLGAHVQTIETAKNAHCVAFDRSNRFVFVPHTGAEAIFQFVFDADTGELTPNPASSIVKSDKPEVKREPRHLWFHPTANFAYVSMEAGSAIGAYRFDPQAGTLSLLTTRGDEGRELPEIVSTIPHDFTGNNTTASIELTPDGRFAYVSNRGHDSLAGFRVDAATGLVRPTDPTNTPTEKTPRAFTIHPSGKWLFAAGQDSDRLVSYAIGDDGQLTPLQTLPVGKSPAWVQVIEVPRD